MSEVKQYIFGTPFETDAVIGQVSVNTHWPEYIEIEQSDHYQLTYQMNKKDQIFGLGENVRGINKRGFIYESNCSDDPNHDEGKRSLYGAHNFLILRGERKFGLFIDFPGKVIFDLGYTHANEMKIEIEGQDFKVFLIEDDELSTIAKCFRQLIGKSYIPPKWAFGYQQSRWSYRNEQEVEEVVKGYRENDMPLDAIYLDIDYMEGYKDFTVDKEAFPDFKGLGEKLKAQGIRLVPIIDAGIKVEPGYDVYDEGVNEGYFCKNEKDEDFVGAVWPGKVLFPDFLNKKARKWFGKKYKTLLDQGVEGFWNDMNEPAIFYTDQGLEEAFAEINKQSQLENIEIDEYFHFKEVTSSISNSPKDYQRFYHNVEGKKVRHDKVHNLYGYNMTRAASEAFDEIEPNKRLLIFSRSSYIGMHRYGGIWTGDNKSWWSHLEMNIKMMPNLNLCGFLYSGADIGGFGDHTTFDLVLRWLEFGIFTPLMRNHSAIGTRRQEAYEFECKEDFKHIIELRYMFLPYLYSEYMKAALEDKLYFRPLGFDYEEDETAWQVEDQLMVGESLMIAPVYKQNTTARYVYLPEKMLMIKFKSAFDRTYEVLEKGHHYINVELNEVLCFVKLNHLLPLAKPSLCISDLDEEKIELCGYVDEEAYYKFYQDDGFTKDYLDLDHYTYITVQKLGEETLLTTSKDEPIKFSLNIRN